LSSAASAANAAISHMRSWALGTAKGDWVSMGIHSDGSYGIQKGLIYSFPCTCKDGKWSIVQGLKINDFSRAKMQATEKELSEEMEAVKHLLPEVKLWKQAASKSKVKAKPKAKAKAKPAAKKKAARKAKKK
jgi:malate/lactate dehydrogenase